MLLVLVTLMTAAPGCPNVHAPVELRTLKRQVEHAAFADQLPGVLRDLGLLATQGHAPVSLRLDVFSASVFADPPHPVVQLRGTVNGVEVRFGVALVPLPTKRLCAVRLQFLEQSGPVVFRFRHALSVTRDAIEVDNPGEALKVEGMDSSNTCESTSLWTADGFSLTEVLHASTNCESYAWAPGFSGHGVTHATLTWSSTVPATLRIDTRTFSSTQSPDGSERTESSSASTDWSWKDGRYVATN